MKEGLLNGTLSRFKLLPLTDAVCIQIKGIANLMKSTNRIYVTVSNDCFNYVRDNPSMLYEMIFEPNQQSFQLQHNALHYIDEHKLFDSLINNSKYDHTERSDQFGTGKDYNFRYFKLYFLLVSEKILPLQSAYMYNI